MKKAINLYCVNGDTKEKLDTIKKVGFDGVLLGVNSKNETMSLEQQVEYCKKIGLGVSMIHCAYNEQKLNDFWVEKSKDGENIEKNLISQIEQIKNLGVKNFVIHTSGSKDVKNSKIGIERLKNILTMCKKYDINLCIENLYSDSQVEYIFNNLNSKNLFFCYDCGHDNFLTPNSKLVEEFYDKLTTTHLHDNDGKKDTHLPIGSGLINQQELVRKLSKCQCEYLSAETKETNPDTTLLETFLKNLQALNKLDDLIEKYKKSEIF